VTRELHGLWRSSRGLLTMLGIMGVTAVVHLAVVNQRAFLHFYYLPVVFAAYTMGLRKGVYAALLSCGIVFASAAMNDAHFAAPDAEGWMRWLDLGTWACFLILASFLIGSLYDVKGRQVRELEDAYRGILEIMSKLIDSADRYTENHSRRVADYSVEMARRLGLSETEVEDIRVGAFLHDIGKVEISADVLGKAAGLTPEEMDEMRGHVDKGERLVRSVGGILRHVLPMVAYHHERWDGTGYKALQGEEIPLGARIIAVADTYDAIVTDRAYRKGRTRQQAFEILQEGSGSQFDPLVVEVFLQLYGAPGKPSEVVQAA
jgi:putative nucleotidyltransferase with HDIG domain